jgi:Leucine-rich repeat (LRR) protein
MLTTLALVQLAGSTGLTGSIPTELCKLTNLEGLYMNVNRLSSSIPSCLGDLRNLQVLNLAANELVGIIPTELCQLSKLEELHLTLNMIDGSIPSCIGSLPMAVLDVADNMLTGSIPSEIGNLEETLSAFSADGNMLTGDPSDIFNKLVRLYHLTASSNRLNFTMESTFLENTRYLRYFDLSDNEIDGIFPVHLLTTDYQFLLIMDLSRNDLTGEFTDGVNIASPVRYLGAHDNRMTGSLENLVNLTSLIHLDLSNNQFTGSMDPAGALIHVTNLFLSENPFDAGPIPESFGLLRNLQELSLRNTSLTGTIPESIAENWTIVELIDLGSNNLVGSIPKIFGDLLNLEYLLLFGNYGINGTVPAGFRNRTQLKGVLLDRTSINGTEALELFCALPNFINVTGTELLIVDCNQQECTECEGCRCCNDAETSACSRPQLGNIDGMWITNFRRPANEFNFTDELKVSVGN